MRRQAGETSSRASSEELSNEELDKKRNSLNLRTNLLYNFMIMFAHYPENISCAAGFLLSNNIDLNAQYYKGNTLLHLWVYRYQEQISGKENSSNKNIRDVPWNSLKKNMPFLGWMLINGYDTGICNNENKTALQLLIEVAPQDIVIDEEILKNAYRYWEMKGKIKNLTYKNNTNTKSCNMM